MISLGCFAAAVHIVKPAHTTIIEGKKILGLTYRSDRFVGI
jgi:hypothetical protein